MPVNLFKLCENMQLIYLWFWLYEIDEYINIRFLYAWWVYTYIRVLHWLNIIVWIQYIQFNKGICTLGICDCWIYKCIWWYVVVKYIYVEPMCLIINYACIWDIYIHVLIYMYIYSNVCISYVFRYKFIMSIFIYKQI